MSFDPRPEIGCFYFDESGHGGDLSSAKGLGFADQPVFALACVGSSAPAELGDELERLRATHRCGPGELKSTMARLPQFVSDLVAFLDRRSWPIFIELVDKRFFVAIHIVNHLLCAGRGLAEFGPVARNAAAEFIADGPSEAALLAYLAACRSETPEDLRKTVQLLWDWLEASDDGMARGIQMLLFEPRDRLARPDADPADFLPLADISVTGRKVWMLPNLQCLTNIYGRVNLYHPGGLDGVRFVHDEQLQYAKVLTDATALLEALAADNALPAVPFADYQLRGRADLAFATTATDPCLQAADLLAGCAMRFARAAMQPRRRVGDPIQRAFDAILHSGEPSRGTGINLVFTNRMLHHMRVPAIDASLLMEGHGIGGDIW